MMLRFLKPEKEEQRHSGDSVSLALSLGRHTKCGQVGSLHEEGGPVGGRQEREREKKKDMAATLAAAASSCRLCAAAVAIAGVPRRLSRGSCLPARDECLCTFIHSRSTSFRTLTLFFSRPVKRSCWNHRGLGKEVPLGCLVSPYVS